MIDVGPKNNQVLLCALSQYIDEYRMKGLKLYISKILITSSEEDYGGGLRTTLDFLETETSFIPTVSKIRPKTISATGVKDGQIIQFEDPL